MIDVVEPKTFKSFTILNKALLLLIKLITSQKRLVTLFKLSIGQKCLDFKKWFKNPQNRETFHYYSHFKILRVICN